MDNIRDVIYDCWAILTATSTKRWYLKSHEYLKYLKYLNILNI